MKSFLLMMAGVTAGLAYLITTQRRTAVVNRQAAPVEDLAHKLQDAWTDHHTIA